MFKHCISIFLALVAGIVSAYADVVRTPNHVGAFDIAWVAHNDGTRTSCNLGRSGAYEPVLHASTVDPRWSAVRVHENRNGHNDLVEFRPGADGKITEYPISSCAVGSIVVMPAHKVEHDRTGDAGRFELTGRGEAPPAEVLIEAAKLL